MNYLKDNRQNYELVINTKSYISDPRIWDRSAGYARLIFETILLNLRTQSEIVICNLYWISLESISDKTGQYNIYNNRTGATGCIIAIIADILFYL